ncbi:ABC transporter ATP-binding protein [Neorhizobium sp. P12A]|jgi:ABC-type Fe3+/spermidine/putrescine transport system ATPase subunit|uniref:ABC transporter ATP-binding protein n=1 Tax=Neorhizobium sp. P12A TaxID=2268027 RepID=UPI00165E6F8E|nr:ABC transporter ATP-binding protein [Neorhizobium sp. P12A]
MTASLDCVGINKSLGGAPVLRNLHLKINAGEVVSLLGASGSGKTTLLRIIAGLINPDSGLVKFDDTVVWSDRSVVPPEKRRVGMVFQDYALWPHMTVSQNLTFGLQSQRLSDAEQTMRAEHALEVTRLAPYRNRYPAELSGGQQQRVAIARCLAARPALMLFDEPLSNLDAALREDMRVEMMELVRREAITAVYVTHDQAEAMAVSDRIAVMRSGVIAQLDTPQAIYETPADAFVASFIGGFSIVPGQASNGQFKIENASNEPLRTSGAHNGNALLVVRPEDARPRDAFPDNSVQGIVQSSAFQGRCWRLILDIGPHRIKLDWPQAMPAGAPLTFSLPPERCVVLAA